MVYILTTLKSCRPWQAAVLWLQPEPCLVATAILLRAHGGTSSHVPPLWFLFSSYCNISEMRSYNWHLITTASQVAVMICHCLLISKYQSHQHGHLGVLRLQGSLGATMKGREQACAAAVPSGSQKQASPHNCYARSPQHQGLPPP